MTLVAEAINWLSSVSQARPSAALNAPPGSEAMPTQGLPRSRP